MRIVHYINQFYGQIGGEDKADFPLKVEEGVVGPGNALNEALTDGIEIVATIICGDNYFAENEAFPTRRSSDLTYLLQDLLLLQEDMVWHAEAYAKPHIRS